MQDFLSNIQGSPERKQPPATPEREETGPLSILVVDDEQSVRNGLAHILSLKGFHSRAAHDTTSALESLAKERFDIVIADLRMPGEDGIELLRKAKESWPHIQFIMMTAYGEVQSYLEARNLGAVEYFNKPVRLEDLMTVLSRIRNQLGLSTTEPQDSESP